MAEHDIRVGGRGAAWVSATICTASLLAGCSAATTTSKVDAQFGVAASERIVASGQPVPSGGGSYKIGNPYKIAGRWFHPQEDPDYDEVGLASWYGSDFHGRRTANGEIFDMHALSAAHPTLPMPTYARVTNLENGRSAVVRINDRGPFAHDRLIDLSQRTAEALGFKEDGTAMVRVQYVGTAHEDGGVLRMAASAPSEGLEAPAKLSDATSGVDLQGESSGLGLNSTQEDPMPIVGTGQQFGTDFVTAPADPIGRAFGMFDAVDARLNNATSSAL